MALKQKAAEGLALYELRTGRGGGLIHLITDVGRDMLQGGVYLFALRGLAAVLSSYNFSLFQILANVILWIPPWVIVPIPIGKKILEYYLGWKDEKIGYSKWKNGYSSKYINGYNEEVLARIKTIEKNTKEIMLKRH